MGKESLFKKIARDIGKTGAINNAELTRANNAYEKVMREGLGYDQILMDWYKNKLREESTKLWERAEPKLNITDGGLAGVKKDNKFKTVYETHNSGGGDNEFDRADVENELLGRNYSAEERMANPQLNPIYGYQDGNVSSMYGRNIVTLKPSAKNMMTYSLGDSEMDHRLGRYGFPDWTAITDARHFTKWLKKHPERIYVDQELVGVRKRLEDLQSINEGTHSYRDFGRPDFIENQYYGGLTADDIAKIRTLDGREKQLSDFEN